MRLLSAYQTPSGERLYIITEWGCKGLRVRMRMFMGEILDGHVVVGLLELDLAVAVHAALALHEAGEELRRKRLERRLLDLGEVRADLLARRAVDAQVGGVAFPALEVPVELAEGVELACLRGALLYRNDGGHFAQTAAEAGVEDMASGMSVAWGDYNRDGRADLYVGNMFSSAGNRISYQRAFTESGDADAVESLRRMARGNSLFAAHPDGRFRDVSEASRAHLGRWAWSSGFIDINNDGWDDLAVANGFLTGRRPDDL